jgi:hypothetical protein
MLLHDGNYLSVRCGVEIDVTADEQPLVVIKASGGEPNMRVLMLGNKELHACRMDGASEKRFDR